MFQIYFSKFSFIVFIENRSPQQKTKWLLSLCRYNDTGRCHAAEVWRNSFGQRDTVFKKMFHFLGDGTYPQENYLMIPYRNNGFLNCKEKNLNTILNSTRVHIKQAFRIFTKIFHINFFEVPDRSFKTKAFELIWYDVDVRWWATYLIHYMKILPSGSCLLFLISLYNGARLKSFL